MELSNEEMDKDIKIALTTAAEKTEEIGPEKQEKIYNFAQDNRTQITLSSGSVNSLIRTLDELVNEKLPEEIREKEYYGHSGDMAFYYNEKI